MLRKNIGTIISVVDIISITTSFGSDLAHFTKFSSETTHCWYHFFNCWLSGIKTKDIMKWKQLNCECVYWNAVEVRWSAWEPELETNSDFAKQKKKKKKKEEVRKVKSF